MWVVFEPVKKKEMLEKVVQGLFGQGYITRVDEGWILSLWLGKNSCPVRLDTQRGARRLSQ